MKTMTPINTETEDSLRNSLTDEQVSELMADDMLPEYDIDYSKARPNRFANREAAMRTITLDPDVARVFNTDEAVNKILRALIQSMPQNARRETV